MAKRIPERSSAESPWEGSGALELHASTYGFAKVSLSPALQARANPRAVLDAIEAPLESLAWLLSLGSGVGIEQARGFCGLLGQIELRLVDPGELPDGVGALFDPDARSITLSGIPIGIHRAGAHLGHEWAHSLDFILGSRLAHDPREAPTPAFALDSIAREARSSPAPYQAVLGVMAKAMLDTARSLPHYASSAIGSWATPTQVFEAALPAFAAVVKSLLPRQVHAMPLAQRKARLAESSAQWAKLSEFIVEAAYECLAKDRDIERLGLSEPRLRVVADFCARAVLSRSARESAGRRGRENAMDAAKSDIAAYLKGALRLKADISARVASSIFHITSLKDIHNDPFYSAPYTGRASWMGPGSLADMSCALIRVCRNQRSLANSALAKERFVPMAFWWSMRRQVSEHASRLGERAAPILLHLASTGAVPSMALEHAAQWIAQRGDYKAGALVFSDLIGTGAKMIRQEAELMGRDISEREAQGLRKTISAPINEIAQRKATVESFAESFEQFVLSQSGLPTRLGKACRIGLAHALIDTDANERRAALDPSSSWMNNKDGDVLGNARRWRVLLRKLPSLLSAPPTPPAPRHGQTR